MRKIGIFVQRPKAVSGKGKIEEYFKKNVFDCLVLQPFLLPWCCK